MSSTLITRSELQKRVSDLYKPFMRTFRKPSPALTYQAILANRYEVHESAQLKLEQLYDLVEYFESRIQDAS